jgi:IS605 OrfB family transposase
MMIRKAFKFKLKTTKAAENKLSQAVGCCRLVWNKALALNLDRLSRKEPLMWEMELSFWLTFWKKTDELFFLKESPSQPLQQTVRNLCLAFKDGFDKKQPLKRLPVFKKRGRNESYRYPQGFKFQGRRIFLPKIGWIRFHKSRNILGSVKNVTVSRMADGWYISVQTEVELEERNHPSTSSVGIDLGVVRFATLSDGTFFEPLNSFKRHEEALAKSQRKLSRQVKGSNNWKKQSLYIGRIHQTIKNCRVDRLQWISSKISKKHAIIVLEDLQISKMSKSAAGSLDSPGEHVARKSSLNKSILDQGWGMFGQMLGYKQDWLGGEVLRVNPAFTSQKCPRCGTIDSKNRLTQADFVCTACEYKNNADYVGAT